MPREARGRQVGRKELRRARKEKKKEDKERKEEGRRERRVGFWRAMQRAQFSCLSTKNLPSSFIRARLLVRAAFQALSCDLAAAGVGELRGARRARRKLNTNITKAPGLVGMQGKSRSLRTWEEGKRGACALADGETGPGPGRARVEPRAAGGSAGAAGLAVSERLGQRAWARGGHGCQQGPARPGGLPAHFILDDSARWTTRGRGCSKVA